MKKAMVFLLVLLAGTGILSAQQRHALVFGNSNYVGISALRNPANDARDMRDALQGLGFQVDMVLDGTSEQMETAIDNLRRRLGASPDSYGFFFNVGHGLQSAGENYLIPVNADTITNDITWLWCV